MPIFEYQCKKCGKILEVLEKWNEYSDRSCLECAKNLKPDQVKPTLKRIVSAGGFDLKGEGFYRGGRS